MSSVSSTLTSSLSIVDLFDFKEDPVQASAAPEVTEMEKIEKELAEIDARLLQTSEDERVMFINELNDEIPFVAPHLGLSDPIPGLGLTPSASIFDIAYVVVRKIDQLKRFIEEFENSPEGKHIDYVLRSDLGSERNFINGSSGYRNYLKNKKHLAELGVSDQDPLYVLGKRKLTLLDQKYDLEFRELQARIDVLEGTLQGMLFRQMFDLGIAIPKIMLTPTLKELRALYGKQFHVVKKMSSPTPSFV